MKKILIGFLSATCFFLFIGATSSNSDNGRYQAFGTMEQKFMIDTRTGQAYVLKGMGRNNATWKKYDKAIIK